MNRKIAVLGLVVLCVLAGAYWWRHSSANIVSVEAVVEGRMAAVGSGVSGVVKEVYVSVGDAVSRDQPLLALDPSGYERQLAQERARLAELASQLPPGLLVPSPGSARPVHGKPLAALREEEEAARRRVEAAAQSYAAANLAFSRMAGQGEPEYRQADPGRQAALIARDEAAISLKKAKDNFDKASYARAQREAQDKADKANGVVSAGLAARLAEYQAQISRVRLAKDSVAATVLTAPENGTVFLVAVRPGQTVNAGDSPVAIVPEENSELWVFAAFAKADKDRLAAGTACEVALEGTDALAKGRLGYLLPGQETEKTVAVRVILDQDTLPAAFSPGKAASVSVPVGGFNLPEAVRNMFGKPTRN
ncbi:MAG: efflux RND transporter periplasmic adaptor subunit [Deltaproteobacteria bacterium]|nr:efflux RND transporter periplasmic adaptor subunit [Deltaproteobacteria bacterium]